MKIKRIQVKNIGPYVNENAFDFDVSYIAKRMVLIGGKWIHPHPTIVLLERTGL